MNMLKKDYHIIIRIYLWVAVFLGLFLGFGNVGNLPANSGNLTIYLGATIIIRTFALILVIMFNKTGIYMFYLSIILEIIIGFFIAPKYGFIISNYMQPLMTGIIFSIILLVRNNGTSGWEIIFHDKNKVI